MSSTSRTRWFYAIHYAYGRTVVNHGNRPDEVHRFATVAERQRFIAQAENDVDLAPATHPMVRKALRYAAQLNDEWPIAV